MIQIRLLDSRKTVADTLTHPRLYDAISDDCSPDSVDMAERLQHLQLPGAFLGTYDEDEYLGLFWVHPQNGACYEAHICLLPAAWGTRTIASLKAFHAWVFANTPCQRIVGSVPQFNRLAYRLAINSGMTEYGVNPQSFLKNGKLWDQWLVGINKPHPASTKSGL